MKRCNDRYLHTDQRSRSDKRYANSDATVPPEWEGRIELSGRRILLDGALVGEVFRSSAGWTSVSTAGARHRTLSKVEAIRRILPVIPVAE